MLAVACAATVFASAAASLPQITPAEFAQRSDVICTDYLAKVRKLPRTAIANTTGTYELAVAVLVIAKFEVARIRALPLPTANRTLAQAWERKWFRLPGLVTELREAARNKDVPLIEKTVATLDANGATARRLARSLGMKVCTRNQ
jgi:hypothetical protein